MGAVLAVASAAVALTCAAQNSFGSDDALGAPVAPRAGLPSVEGLLAPSPAKSALSPQAETSLGLPPELARFRTALTALEQGERSESVRILWLGDSHTAADFMTGAVRSALWARYPAGGPGFVRLGASGYRHDRAVLNRVGRFRTEPEPPSRQNRHADGVFGLGGMRVAPLHVGAEMRVSLPRSALRGKAKFSVLYDLPGASAFEATLGTHKVRVPSGQRGRGITDSPILRLELESDVAEPLKLVATRGQPRFYGVIVEGSEPGVVLDTAGINGARLATALAWAEQPFIAEVAERRPELFVVAYGTNEAFDARAVDAYGPELVRLLGRLRRAAPDADCLVFGPPDALEPGATPAPRISEINAVYARTARQSGCAFIDGQSMMGGPGTFLGWMHQKPPLAQGDRIHLTAAGYRELGTRIALKLLDQGVLLAGGTDAVRTNSP